VASSRIDKSSALITPELLVVAGQSEDGELRFRGSCWLTKSLEKQKPTAVVIDDIAAFVSRLGQVESEGDDSIWLYMSAKGDVLAATAHGGVIVAPSRPANATDLAMAMPPADIVYDGRLKGVLNVEASWLTGVIPTLAGADSAIVDFTQDGLRLLPLFGENEGQTSCSRGAPQHFTGYFVMKWKAENLAGAFRMFSRECVTLTFDHPSAFEMAKLTIAERTLGWSFSAQLVYSPSLEDFVEAGRMALKEEARHSHQ
jgi:hypothetical protein